MKKVLNIFVWVVLLSAVILLPAFSSKERSQMPCSGQEFSVGAGDDVVLVTAGDLDTYITSHFDTLKGRPATTIDPNAVELWLSENPYVLSAEAHLDLKHTLHIEVTQEQPLFRIFRASGSSCYLSKSGRIIPLRDGIPVRVPVLSGFLGEVPLTGQHINEERNPRLMAAHRLGLLLTQDSFLRLLVSQVYIGSNGDISMEPRIARHSILLGDTTSIENKLENLVAFYKQGLIRGPWDRYEVINLKYKDQVVCTKRKSYEII